MCSPHPSLPTSGRAKKPKGLSCTSRLGQGCNCRTRATSSEPSPCARASALQHRQQFHSWHQLSNGEQQPDQGRTHTPAKMRCEATDIRPQQTDGSQLPPAPGCYRRPVYSPHTEPALDSCSVEVVSSRMLGGSTRYTLELGLVTNTAYAGGRQADRGAKGLQTQRCADLGHTARLRGTGFDLTLIPVPCGCLICSRPGRHQALCASAVDLLGTVSRSAGARQAGKPDCACWPLQVVTTGESCLAWRSDRCLYRGDAKDPEARGTALLCKPAQ